MFPDNTVTDVPGTTGAYHRIRMARYKVLQSVAHGLGHSFASCLNYDTDDYVMGHLLSRARETREPALLIDLSTGTAAPSALITPPIGRAVERYSGWLPDLVRRHASDMRFVRAARMTVTFDLSRERPAPYAPTSTESPFVLRVEIEDDRGKVWAAEQRDWWFPEPPRDSHRKATRRWGWLTRLQTWWHSLRYGTPFRRSRSATA